MWYIVMFSFLKQKNIFNFFKNKRSTNKLHNQDVYLNILPLPKYFIIPLKQHVGYEGEICVTPGDMVLRGQALTLGKNYMLPVHAPTSGVIKSINYNSITDSSSTKKMHILLIPDHKDQQLSCNSYPDYKKYNRIKIIEHINNLGIVSLGGTGIPSAIELTLGLNYQVDVLIINTYDFNSLFIQKNIYLLIEQYVYDIIEGINIIIWLLQPNKTVLIIEESNIQAIILFKRGFLYNKKIQIKIISAKYEFYNIKQFIYDTIGQVVPVNKEPIDVGIFIQNINTIKIIKRAIINGEPLTERIITIINKKNTYQILNILIRLGTPVNHLLHHIDNILKFNTISIIDKNIVKHHIDLLKQPLTKTISCILIFDRNRCINNKTIMACINCSKCSDICPVKLFPQQIYAHIEANNNIKLYNHDINKCIECRFCDYVCPSNIALSKSFHRIKIKLLAINIEKQRIINVKKRIRIHKNRLKNIIHLNNYKNIHVLNKTMDTELIGNHTNKIKDNYLQKDIKSQTNIERKITVQEAINRAQSRKTLLPYED
ncbi:MAG: RnfABCDGE type electron transport complex subunit C [Pantoea sp. Brub]|nr:RnfABCDGE type electron transport complex subunit C [Pantoea sp. Brub]